MYDRIRAVKNRVTVYCIILRLAIPFDQMKPNYLSLIKSSGIAIGNSTSQLIWKPFLSE